MSQPETPPPAPRRSNCLLIGCVVLFALVTIPGAVVWGLIAAAGDGGPDIPRHEVRQHVLPAGPGTVELGIRLAEVEISSAPAGSPLRLEGDWNAGAFHLDEGIKAEDGGWRYHLRFGGKGLALLHHRGHHAANRLRLQLPLDRRVSIDGKISLGESDLELGGLALERVDLALGTGSHTVSFHQPTTGALSLLKLDGSMGEITVLGAGNASPRRLELRHGMGELLLDLTGRWRGDADVELHLGMGDSRVELPRADEAGAIVEQARVSLGDRSVSDVPIAELPAGLPRVRVRATGGMGDLRIQ